MIVRVSWQSSYHKAANLKKRIYYHMFIILWLPAYLQDATNFYLCSFFDPVFHCEIGASD